MLLHDFRRLGLQDRIGVIADQLVDVARRRWAARPVHHRAGTRWRRLEAGQVGWAHMPEKSGMDAAPCVPLRPAQPRAPPFAPGGRRSRCRQCHQQKEIPPLHIHANPPFHGPPDADTGRYFRYCTPKASAACSQPSGTRAHFCRLLRPHALQQHAPCTVPLAHCDVRRHAALAHRLGPLAARGEGAAGRQVGEVGRGTRDGREAGAFDERLVGARREQARGVGVGGATRRLSSTKNIASTRIVPCSSGRSRWKIAALRRNPVPGQENTVSTRIDPPSR